MDTEKFDKTFILGKEIEAVLRGIVPVEKQNIPAGSTIKILPSSSNSAYEFKVLDGIFKNKDQVCVIARIDLDGWIAESIESSHK